MRGTASREKVSPQVSGPQAGLPPSRRYQDGGIRHGDKNVNLGDDERNEPDGNGKQHEDQALPLSELDRPLRLNLDVMPQHVTRQSASATIARLILE